LIGEHFDGPYRLAASIGQGSRPYGDRKTVTIPMVHINFRPAHPAVDNRPGQGTALDTKLHALRAYVSQNILRTAGTDHPFAGIAREKLGGFVPKEDPAFAIDKIHPAVQARHQLY
jgi:hypothetical protein